MAAHAAPDGYTVLLTISGKAINATLYTHLNFDFARSNARRCHRPHAFRDRGQSWIPRQIRSRIDRICEVKSWQDKHCFGWAGNWTTCRLRAKMMTGVDMVQVPYKASYMTDLFGGQIPIAFSPIAQIIQDVRAGKLTAIGVTTPTRSDAAPEIPAIAEFVPGYAASGWYGICAPTGTPDEIVEKLNAATTASVTDPNLKSRLLNLDVEPMPMLVANFKKFVADEIAKYAKVIQFASIKVE